jgi:hypothetical protein
MPPTLFIFSIEEIFDACLWGYERHFRARLRHGGLVIDQHASFLMIREAFQRHVDAVAREDGLPQLRVVVTPFSDHTEESELWLERASLAGWTIVENLGPKMNTSIPAIDFLWRTYRIGDIDCLGPLKADWVCVRIADTPGDDGDDDDECDECDGYDVPGAPGHAAAPPAAGTPGAQQPARRDS